MVAITGDLQADWMLTAMGSGKHRRRDFACHVDPKSVTVGRKKWPIIW
jgi:hypothetical protein